MARNRRQNQSETSSERLPASDGAELPLIPPHLLHSFTDRSPERRARMGDVEARLLSEHPLDAFEAGRVGEVREALTSGPKAVSSLRDRRLLAAGIFGAIAVVLGLVIGFLL